MSEYDNNRTDYEPNFIMKPSVDEDPASDPAKAGVTVSEMPKADTPLDSASEAVTPEADRSHIIQPALKAEVPKEEVAKAEVLNEDIPKAESLKAEVPKEEVPKAEAPKAETPKAEAVKPAAEQPRSEKTSASESPAAEVLRAAAARAEALKAAAAKIDPEMEPYRRKTSEIENPIYRGMPVEGNFAGSGENASRFGGSSGTPYGAGADNSVNTGNRAGVGMGASTNTDTGAGMHTGAGAGADNSVNTDNRASAGNGAGSSYGSVTGQPYGSVAGRPYGSASGKSYDAASGKPYDAAAARPYNAGSGRPYNGAAGGARSGNGRPAFENPSFDPGQTGSYTDPRDHFRPGESASWSNGEVHRSKRQMKDSIHKQKKQKKAPRQVNMTRRGLALLVACCMFLSCLFGFGASVLSYSYLAKNTAGTAQTAQVSSSPGDGTTSSAGYSLENATGSSMTIKEITAATQKSVVEIRTESVASDSWMQQYVTEGAGSGVIISEDGYIMTNNHVIEGANKIKVTTADGKEYQAKLIGTDESNDVAVLKIDASGLTPATYGNSDQLEVGDMAVVIGNPLGELGGTVTAGIISATDRELSIDGKTLHLLQTDGSINPGNSGGGLFNGNGQLVGLVVAKSAGSDVEGLGFAIPINTAADVAQQLIDKGYVSGQPYTGMTYQEGTGSSANGSDPFNSFDSFFGSSASGVFIYSVNGKNAKKAGFQPGDQVYAVDGKEISTFKDLTAIITAHKVGDKLTFTIIRDGVQKNIKLELEEKTAANSAADSSDNGGQNQQEQPEQADPGNGFGNQQPDQQPNEDPSNGSGGWQDLFNYFF